VEVKNELCVSFLRVHVSRTEILYLNQARQKQQKQRAALSFFKVGSTVKRFSSSATSGFKYHISGNQVQKKKAALSLKLHQIIE